MWSGTYHAHGLVNVAVDDFVARVEGLEDGRHEVHVERAQHVFTHHGHGHQHGSDLGGKCCCRKERSVKASIGSS
jgi:hypothetical protein